MEILKKNRLRNIAVAVASFAVVITNYGYQLAHPVTAVEILASMERQSAPLAAVGGSVGGMVRPFHGASLVNYLEFDGALCRQICRGATFVLPPSRH